ncbi:MAG TPA: group 1 truncated hemoglobin [Thermoanaerobaculia bacterium]|nr:group 1 truncated hemoglobin [Thermoanaerobaculia bacterium]
MRKLERRVPVLAAMAALLALAGAACRPAASPAPAPRQAAQPSTAAAESTLYQRIGGYDAIAAAVDGLLGRMLADPEIAPFFSGMSRTSKVELREHLIGLLCEMSGGPCHYIGRDVRASHEGLGITGEHWRRTVAHLHAVLDALGVPARERDEVIAAVALLEEDIVERP